MAEYIEQPSNFEAECAVLGACLISKAASAIVISSCSEDSFFDKRNKDVFKAIKELVGRNEAIDSETVHGELINMKLADEVGGNDYLLQLADSILNVENLEHYIKLVNDQELLRKLLISIKEAEKQYAGGIPDIDEFIANYYKKVTEIAYARQVGGFKSAKEVTELVNINLKQLAADQGRELIGLDTGYAKLNEMTHGFRKQDLIIVAARPSMGKTALTLNLAYNAAYRENKAVAFFSLEMNSTQVMNRLIANRAMVSNDHIQTGKLTPNEKVKVAAAMEEIASVPLYFEDQPKTLLGDIISKATKLKHSRPDLSLIVIDYLGKINTTKNGKVESREREVAFVTNQLKQLARELDLPVILVCQINRNAETNEGKRPSMANLRESGSIEADADQVLLLYREDYYTAVGQSVQKKKSFGKDNEQQQSRPQPQKGPGQEEDNSIMDVILAKNRNGKVGTIHLLFSKQYSRFDNLSAEFEEMLAQHQSMMGNSDE